MGKLRKRSVVPLGRFATADDVAGVWHVPPNATRAIAGSRMRGLTTPVKQAGTLSPAVHLATGIDRQAHRGQGVKRAFGLRRGVSRGGSPGGEVPAPLGSPEQPGSGNVADAMRNVQLSDVGASTLSPAKPCQPCQPRRLQLGRINMEMHGARSNTFRVRDVVSERHMGISRRDLQS